MRIVTRDDIIDVYSKLKQRGLAFLASKLTTNPLRRTKSAFNELNISGSNFWIIPKINKKWNKMISGNEHMEYEDFVMQTYFKDQKNLKMLSIGSGICTHELKFATYANFDEILCMDINEILFEAARKKAKNQGLTTIQFQLQSLYDHQFPEDYYDIIFFHASLHHFKNIDHLLGQTLYKTLKKDGKIIINEFVGATRLQFPVHQIKAMNSALKRIPKKFRKRFQSRFYKNRVSGPGILRMIIADPSECIDSSSILPSLQKHFNPIYEVPLGGNLLMTVLKDISHHFVKLDNEKEAVLERLFAEEENYLKEFTSDFIFGIYEKK